MPDRKSMYAFLYTSNEQSKSKFKKILTGNQKGWTYSPLRNNNLSLKENKIFRNQGVFCNTVCKSKKLETKCSFVGKLLNKLEYYNTLIAY